MPDTRIYPYIRKVDTESSNSYLIQTPDILVLIDPGGLPEQAAQLVSRIREVQAERPLPLMVLLTHSHVDHYVAALSVPLLVDSETAVVAAQASGIMVLESADRQMTQAEILGRELTPLRVDLPLLAGSETEGSARHSYPNGAILEVVHLPPWCGLPQEELRFGTGPSLRVYHTPGHSPDSCCVHIGGVLFTGDLLFATAPGIAGFSGWDQAALVRSLDSLHMLLTGGEIEVVCSGHGPLICTIDALRMLTSIRHAAGRLTDIARLNPERAQKTAVFAEDCMEQVNELFTVITGRLYYAAHIMEELEEGDLATGLGGLIRGEIIDELLEGFDAFNQEYQSGRYVPLNLALKGGQVVGKLQRSFNREELARIIDPTLVRRAVVLLDDYIAMLQGFAPSWNVEVHDLRGILQECITAHTERLQSDDAVLDVVDDEAAFGRILLARIGMPPLLAETTVTLNLGPDPLCVSLDRSRFLDLLTYLLEDLVGNDATSLAICAEKENNGIRVDFSGTRNPALRTGGSRPCRFLYWLCEQAGGTLVFDEGLDTRRYSVRLKGNQRSA